MVIMKFYAIIVAAIALWIVASLLAEKLEDWCINRKIERWRKQIALAETASKEERSAIVRRVVKELSHEVSRALREMEDE